MSLSPQALLLKVLRFSNHLPPPLSAAFHWRLFCTPFTHKRAAHQLEFLRGGKKLFIPSGDYLLPAWIFGESGPTAVLCHGWKGSAASWFTLAPKLVEAGWRVMVFNAPGHHNRPWRSSLPDFTRALTDVVEVFTPKVLVGHSFGAMTVARVARHFPSLKGLALFSAPNEMEALARGFCHSLRMTEEAEAAFFAKMDASLERPLTDECSERYLEPVTCPILLLHDEEDDVIPLSTSEAIARSKRCELVVTQGLGHRQIIRESALADRVVQFFEPFVSR